MPRPWFALVSLFLLPPVRAGDFVTVTVYHTNDIHGWIMPHPAYQIQDMRRGRRGYGTGGDIGGMAAFAALVRADPGPKLVLDAGDWFQGTPEGRLTKGEAVADCFNAIPYDAVEVGNHDFDLGPDVLRRLVSRMKMPVLGANVRDARTGNRVPYLTPYVLKRVGGVQFGIFGLLTSRMRDLSTPKDIEGLVFDREVDEARRMVGELKARGATVIIAVTHMGYEAPSKKSFEGDRFLASSVPGIDLIVGGHTHTVLKRPVRDPRNGTLIVQAGSQLRYAGRATLFIDKATGRVKRSDDVLIGLYPGVTGTDPELDGVVKKYQASVGRDLDAPIASAARTLRRAGAAESSLGDWAADCLKDWAGAEISFYNSSGLRADIPAGPVTQRELFEVFPFDDRAVVLNLTGRQVRAVLERSLENGVGAQVGGLQVRFDPSAAPGRRLREVRAAGAPLDDDRPYRAATVDFMAESGGYAASVQGGPEAASGDLIRDVAAACARRGSPIEPPGLGRIIEE